LVSDVTTGENNMKPFIFKQWHIWSGTKGILVSDQESADLREFKTLDDAINWLFVNGHKEAVRALNQHKHS